jgi:hypothetical protein
VAHVISIEWLGDRSWREIATPLRAACATLQAQPLEVLGYFRFWSGPVIGTGCPHVSGLSFYETHCGHEPGQSGPGWQGDRMQFHQLRCREFIKLLGDSAAAWPIAAQQASKVTRT